MSEMTDSFLYGSRIIRLKKPVRMFVVDNMRKHYDHILALNRAGRSQSETASILGLSESTIRNWAENLSIDWVNLKRYKPRRRKG